MSIEQYAFGYTTNLSSVIIGKNVKAIGKCCFARNTGDTYNIRMIFRCDPSQIGVYDNSFLLVYATAYYPLGSG